MLLSDSTAAVDRGFKKELYQNVWRVPDYFWFSPDMLEFAGFCLVGGQYEDIIPTPQGWLWSQQLELYVGIHQRQLRFFTPEGMLVPLPEENAQQKAEQAQQRAEQAEQSIRNAVPQMLAMGLSIEQVAQVLN